jgi:hypothetical protein
MDKSLQELAGAAQEKAGGLIDWEELIKQTIKSYGNLMLFGQRLYTFDYDSIWKRYAEELGKDELTDAEWKQALLNAVLEQAEEDDG